LTNGFSKKLDNHVAAAALYVAHYNLCRVHEALRMTPAKALGVIDRNWSIGRTYRRCTRHAANCARPDRTGAPQTLYDNQRWKGVSQNDSPKKLAESMVLLVLPGQTG
jgi:hypothetical protein